MKNAIEFIKTRFWQATTVCLLLLLLAKGCTNNQIAKLEKDYSGRTSVLEKKVDSLIVISSNTADRKEIRDEMEITMFNYLIYEDDLDKGKSSLSDIKNKIEGND